MFGHKDCSQAAITLKFTTPIVDYPKIVTASLKHFGPAFQTVGLVANRSLSKSKKLIRLGLAVVPRTARFYIKVNGNI